MIVSPRDVAPDDVTLRVMGTTLHLKADEIMYEGPPVYREPRYVETTLNPRGTGRRSHILGEDGRTALCGKRIREWLATERASISPRYRVCARCQKVQKAIDHRKETPS